MKKIIALNCEEILVSDRDFLFLAGYNWAECCGYYICSNRDVYKGTQLHLKRIHRIIYLLNDIIIPAGFSIDHIDRNPLNNQLENLRLATLELQQMNQRIDTYTGKTGAKGVYFQPKCIHNPWLSYIAGCGEKTYLGAFATEKEATEVYQAAKLKRDKAEEARVEEILAKA